MKPADLTKYYQQQRCPRDTTSRWRHN